MNKVLMAGTLMLWFVGQAAAAAQLNAPSMSCASPETGRFVRGCGDRVVPVEPGCGTASL